MASEYGWSKDAILYNVYFDELFILVKKINARKTGEYRMQLAIAHNPHAKDYKALWRILEEQDRDERRVEAKFDKTGFERLKSQMSHKGGQFAVKS